MNRFNVFKLLIILSLLTLTCFSSAVRNAMQQKLGNQRNHKNHLLSYDDILDNEVLEQGYVASKYIGAGSFGVVVEAEKKDGSKVAVKIMYTGKKGCSEYSILKEFNRLEMTSVPKLYDMIEIKRNYQKAFCVLVGELASQDLLATMFKNSQAMSYESNTKTMLFVIYKLLDCFDEFNFKKGYLHADIKPENLVAVKHPVYGLEPKIIDFDLTFNVNEKTNRITQRIHPGWVTYTMGYRANELLEYCPNTNCDPDSNYKNYIRDYSYSPEFKEDAFALGQTIYDIIQINRSFLDLSNPLLMYSKTSLVTAMLNSNPNKRLSTRSAFNKFKAEMKKNNVSFEGEEEEVEIQEQPQRRKSSNMFENNLNKNQFDEIQEDEAFRDAPQNLEVLKKNFEVIPKAKQLITRDSDKINILKKEEKPTYKYQNPYIQNLRKPSGEDYVRELLQKKPSIDVEGMRARMQNNDNFYHQRRFSNDFYEKPLRQVNYQNNEHYLIPNQVDKVRQGGIQVNSNILENRYKMNYQVPRHQIFLNDQIPAKVGQQLNADDIIRNYKKYII